VKPFFITTAIDYTNGAPHIGHAYEKVLADVIARYQRLAGREVFFLTGVDQHGQKVQQSAEKAGIAPQEYVDGITAKFRALWTKLGVDYDGWAATTEASHKACVQTLLQRLHDEGQLYKAKQSGYYSVRQEQFLTEKERGPDGEFGPEWGEVILVEEENWWFKLAQHKQWLLDLLDKRPELVVPNFRLAELRNAIAKLEGDLCISRPKSRLTWGIELPFDRDYVTYVWFDALVNYISFAPGFLEFEAETRRRGDTENPRVPASPRPPLEFQKWWPALHVIGKDIMVPAHGVYWPIMLKAIGFTDDEMPQLLVHGWWNSRNAAGESEKMSKSLGNVVDPDALADKYGAGAVRYYLVADIVTGKDSDFSEERLIQRYNVDLANSLGNLLNRSLNMAGKYREGRLKQSLEGGLSDRVSPLVEAYAATMNDFQISAALDKVLALAIEANQFVEQTKPWALAKAGDDAALDMALYHLAESLRILAILISPVLPQAAEGIFAQLGWTGPMTLDAATWGGLPDGHQLGKPVPLFPRIEAAPAA
jgi:methionyl-tRNA synthetase